MRVDPEGVAGLIAEVAAEEIMPRFGRLAAADIREKGPGDLVTAADHAVERRLAPLLTDLLPGSVVVGEEATEDDPALLDLLSGDAPVWLIDPVDGTANFAAGIPVFGTIIALVRKAQVVAGWIHDPLRERTLIAEAGSGARVDGEPIRVALPSDPARMSGVLNLTTGDREQAARLGCNAHRIASLVMMRCAAADYANLAEGRTHFALYNRIKPWDHAAGWLLHKEAGGHGRFLDGTPYDPRRVHGPLFLAPDAAAWQALVDTLWAT